MTLPDTTLSDKFMSKYHERLLMGGGWIVAILGVLGISGRLLNVPILGTFDPALGMRDAMSLGAGLALLALGVSVILSFSSDPVRRNRHRLRMSCLVAALGISVYNLATFLIHTHFDPWFPFSHYIPKAAMSFITVVNLLLLSLGLLIFNRYRHTWWAPYCLSLIGLFALESACFSSIGRLINVPVLYSFIQAIPSMLALCILGALLLYETVPYQGILSPLFSTDLRVRRLSYLGISTAVVIMATGIVIISLFHAIIIENTTPVEEETLFIGFEFATILLSILVLALSLRLLAFFQNSLLAEQHAKENETRFRLLVSAVHDYAIYMLDPNGNIQTWNEGAEHMTGYRAEEILGRNFSILYLPEEAKKRIPKLQLETAALEGHHESERWRVRKNGEMFWARLTLTPLLDETGQLIGFSNVIRDLTMQKQMEDSLKTSIVELTDMKQAIDAASIVAMTDQQGVITYVNDAFCKISKYTREELMGKTHRLINSNYHSKEFFKDLWQTISQGLIWHGEIRNCAKDGTFYWVDTTIYPFRVGRQTPDRYIAIHHDITPLKAAEEELKKHVFQQKITSILGQHALSGIDINQLFEQTVVLAAHALGVPLCKILELDPSGKNLLLKYGYGWHEGEVGQVTVTAGQDSQAGFTLLVNEPVVMEDIANERRFQVAPMLLEHHVSSGMSVIIRPESSARPFGILSVHDTEPRKFDSEDITFLQTVANILAMAIERKQSEQLLKRFNRELERKVQERTQELDVAKQAAEEANRQKTRVLAFVSHDFKNPLAAMGRFADMLDKQEDQLTEKQHELIQYIITGIAQLRALVTSILDKARMEDGQLTLSLEWVALTPLLKDMKPIIDSLAEERNITVSIDIQPPELGLEADPQFLRQIILNLVSNAIKYNKRNGMVCIRVQDTEQHQFVRLEVQDTGIGIRPSEIPGLFQQYFRVGPASYDQVEGTGLGLAFIKKLIEMHGGFISVDSQVGVGSTFTVMLPNRLSVSAPLSPVSPMDAS